MKHTDVFFCAVYVKLGISYNLGFRKAITFFILENYLFEDISYLPKAFICETLVIDRVCRLVILR